MYYPINRIISVCNELLQTNQTGASTSELIAAAFVLDRMEYLPHGYTVAQAWECLGEWQGTVEVIRYRYMYLINEY